MDNRRDWWEIDYVTHLVALKNISTFKCPAPNDRHFNASDQKLNFTHHFILALLESAINCASDAIPLTFDR